jgi:ribosomal protein S18 acetylase RimI-like enzyme
MNIEFADASHADDVVRLARKLSKMPDNAIEYEKAVDIFLDKIIKSPDYYVLVLTDNMGNVHGTGMLHMQWLMSRGDQPAAHITNVIVDEQFRKMGYGKRIVTNLINLAKGLKAYKITLNCFDENVRFYTQLGFYKHDNGMRINL